MFEARRAIGQYVRSQSDDVSGELGIYMIVAYLMAADAIEAAIQDIRADLVADARARGLTWDQIAQPLNVKATAAHKRFGQGLTPERLAALREEAALADAMTRVGTHATREDLEDFEGTTPTDRLNYLRKIIDGAKRDFEKLNEELVSDDEIAALLDSITRRLPILGALAIDRELWDAVTGWAGQPADPDDSHYYAPATYLYLALRLTLTAAAWIAGIPRQLGSGDLQMSSADDFLKGRSADDLEASWRCIVTASKLFRRKDVLRALEPPQA